MSSQMFCELAALDTAELAICGDDAGWIHRVTASVVDSRICSFANDAPAGCWVVVRHEPVGAVLPTAEVLLVAVQAADTMWVLRAMTRKTFVQAVEAERFDQRADGGLEQAVMLAAALLPSNVLRVAPSRPPSGNAGKLEHYARRKEVELDQSGELVRLGFPMELLARGGFFPAELPAAVMPHVNDLERRATQIRFDTMMMSPQNSVPLSMQEPPVRNRTVATAREAIAAGLAEGTPKHLSPSYRPMVLDYGDDDGGDGGGDGVGGCGPDRAVEASAAQGLGVVPLAAVPPGQAVAAGLPAVDAAQAGADRRAGRESSGGSLRTISSTAAREIQRRAGERCVALVAAGVPDAAARLLGEAGCDVEAFYSMPVDEVIAACKVLPPLHVGLLRRAHGRGQTGAAPPSRATSRAGSRPASVAGGQREQSRPPSVASRGQERQPPPPLRAVGGLADPAPPLAPGPSPDPGFVVAEPPSPVNGGAGAWQAARAAMQAMPAGAERDAALREIDAQLQPAAEPEEVLRLEAALAAVEAALPPGAGRDTALAGMRQTLIIARAAAQAPALPVVPAAEERWWARCVRANCPCPASFDGLQRSYCCATCRSGFPCTKVVHTAPSEPAPPAARDSAVDAAAMETAELKAHLGQVSTRAAELFTGVPDHRLREVWGQAYQILGLRSPEADLRSQRMALAMLGYQINAGLTQTGSSVAGLLQANARVADADSRVCLVLQEIAAVMKPAGQNVAGRATAATAGTADGGVLRRVVDELGANSSTAAEIQRLADAVSSGTRTAGAEKRLLGEVRDLQVGEHGAMVAMILQQEKLDARPAGSNAVSHLGLGVWSGLREIFRWLPGARERAHEHEVPDGVDFAALMASVARGQLSVAKLVPPGLSGDKMLRAMQAGWPLLMALVDEALPRDSTAMPMLRRIYVEACAGSSPADAARTLINSYFEEVSLRYARFTAGTDSEQPSVEAAHQKVYVNFQSDQMRRYVRQEAADNLRAVRERAERQAAERAQERTAAAAKQQEEAAKRGVDPAPKDAPVPGKGGRGGRA